MQQLRLFVAVELPGEVREALSALQDKLRASGGAGVRWARPEGVHLTLKFLGDVPGAQVPLVEEALESAARGQAAFSLSLGTTGFFPNPRRPRVFWVGVAGEVERLAELAKQVEERLGALGFPPEERPFSPHLTLARLGEKVTSAQRESFGKLARSAPWQPNHAFTVDGVSLIRSQLHPEGAIYTCLRRVPLSTNPQG